MKKIWVLSCTFLIGCGNTTSSDNGYLVLTGRIDDKMVSGVKKDIYRIKNLIITSEGGNTSSAIDLGKIIYDHKINIRVEKYCLSACAQYVVPSANQVEFVGKPILALHQSAISVQDFFDFQNIEIDNDSKNLAKKEQDFLNYIGIKEPILNEPIHYLDILCHGKKKGEPAVGSKWGFLIPSAETYRRWIGKKYLGQFAHTRRDAVESYNKYIPRNANVSFILQSETTRRDFNKVPECSLVK